MTRRPRAVRLNKRPNRTVVSLALLLAMFLSIVASACATPEVTPPVSQGGQPEPDSLVKVKAVLTIDAREGYCYSLNWAPDSSAISYAEGSMPENRGFTGSAFIVERIVLRRIPGRGKGPEEQRPELSVDLSPPTGFQSYPGEGHHHPSVGGTSAFYVDRNGDLNRFSGSLPPETIRHDTEVYFWEPPVPDSPVLGDHLVCIVRDRDSNGTEIWLLGPNSCRRIVSYGGSANGINLSLLGLTDRTILVSRSAYGHTNPNGPQDMEHLLDIITLPESCLDE